jgi:hypothetical protein
MNISEAQYKKFLSVCVDFAKGEYVLSHDDDVSKARANNPIFKDGYQRGKADFAGWVLEFLNGDITE